MEPVPGVVWHEIETIKKRYYGNSRVEPEGSMETKPEDVFLYVYLCFFCWVGLLFWDLAHSSGIHILEFLFGLADTKSWNIYQLRNWAKSFERRAMLTEPPRKTSEEPVLRRSVGNTLAITKHRHSCNSQFKGFRWSSHVFVWWHPRWDVEWINHLADDDFDDWGEAKLGSSK